MYLQRNWKNISKNAICMCEKNDVVSISIVKVFYMFVTSGYFLASCHIHMVTAFYVKTGNVCFNLPRIFASITAIVPSCH